ncbi:nuclear transport factor 2 family protein [Pseudoduganella lutea]|nr:nuclear transport factor 2 family protein [Pseudoduganella lutea]
MKRLLATALLLSAFCHPLAHAQPAGDDAVAVAEIGTIVKAFQAAIVAKDRAALEAMFLPADNSWLTVASDAVKRKPGQPRVRPSSYRQFAEFVGNSKLPVEERFYNVRIHSNGSVGAVYFDFDFVEDGKVTNRGAESWHLVKTESGWKISSMVFSLG